MSMMRNTRTMDIIAEFEARNQMMAKELKRIAQMTDVAFEKIDKFLQLVINYPEEIGRLRHLVNCKRISAKGLRSLTRLGNQIAMMKQLGKKPRVSSVYIYRIAVCDAIIIAAKHSPNFLIGMVMGDKESERFMANYEPDDSEDEEKEFQELFG